jgi:putative membrane protein
MMTVLAEREDDVSNIHRRWSFTRLTPGSLKASYAMTFSCAFVVIAVSHVFHLGNDLASLAVHIPLGLGAIFALGLLDALMLRGTPVNKLSKVVHVSSFASLLWAMTVLVGILADALFAKSSTDYIIAGMLLAAGLRVGIFTSVFGASLGRAVAVCLVLPLVFFLAFVPPQSWQIIAEPVGLGFGSLFVALAIVWSALADRSGRPQVQSTFRLLQAFLSAWTENKPGGVEEIIEAKAYEESLSTSVMKLKSKEREIAVVLPDVHPGPFGSVGGSNLSYVLYEKFCRNAVVLHSVSGHALNIPSKREVDRYIAGLDGLQRKDAGGTASEPVQHREGNATATAIAFGSTALVMLSLAPKGMEDVPPEVRYELESHATGLGLGLLLADCHNAMGGMLDKKDRDDLVSAAKLCLEEVKSAPQHEFAAGFASIADVQKSLGKAPDLGQAGIAVLALRIAGTDYAIAWADANNMENNLRDKVIAGASAATVLEVCTSDTHSTSGKRTSEGYFPFGAASSQDAIAGIYAEILKVASERIEPCAFELSSTSSTVKVMGDEQFEDYSSALDRSMKITKVFVGITFAAFVAMQVLAR